MSKKAKKIAEISREWVVKIFEGSNPIHLQFSHHHSWGKTVELSRTVTHPTRLQNGA